MLADMPGSRPAGDPAAVEGLARVIRREAEHVHAVDIANVGSWRGFGASVASGRVSAAGSRLGTVAGELRALAAALDRMADELRDEQRAWDRAQRDRTSRDAAHP